MSKPIQTGGVSKGVSERGNRPNNLLIAALISTILVFSIALAGVGRKQEITKIQVTVDEDFYVAVWDGSDHVVNSSHRAEVLWVSIMYYGNPFLKIIDDRFSKNESDIITMRLVENETFEYGYIDSDIPRFDPSINDTFSVVGRSTTIKIVSRCLILIAMGIWMVNGSSGYSLGGGREVEYQFWMAMEDGLNKTFYDSIKDDLFVGGTLKVNIVNGRYAGYDNHSLNVLINGDEYELVGMP